MRLSFDGPVAVLVLVVSGRPSVAVVGSSMFVVDAPRGGSLLSSSATTEDLLLDVPRCSVWSAISASSMTVSPTPADFGDATCFGSEATVLGPFAELGSSNERRHRVCDVWRSQLKVSHRLR